MAESLVDKFNKRSKAQGIITKKCSDLKVNKHYSVHSFMKVDTSVGEGIIAKLGDSPYKDEDEPKLQIFMPKRFVELLTNEDLSSIQPGQYYLVSHGPSGEKSTELTLHLSHSRH